MDQRIPLKGNHQGWFIGVISFLIPCLSHQQPNGAPSFWATPVQVRRGRQSPRSQEFRSEGVDFLRLSLVKTTVQAGRNLSRPLPCLPYLGPPVVPLEPFFGWEGKIDYRKKGTLIRTSLEDLDTVGFLLGAFAS